MQLHDLNTEMLTRKGDALQAQIHDFFAEARRRRQLEEEPPPARISPVFALLEAWYFWRK